MSSLRKLFAPLARLDWIALFATFALLGIGVLFIQSAKVGSDAGLPLLERQWIKQLLFLGLAAPVYLGAALFDYRQLRDVSGILYAVGAGLLIAVLFLGIEINGARSWFDLRVFTLQPAELAKLSMIVALAAYLGDPLRNTRVPRAVLGALALGGVPFVLILAQPDLGTAMILPFILLSILFVAGIPWRMLGLILVLGLLTLPIAWSMAKPYQKERILVFINPDHDPLNASWNMKQSIMAVGSGGLSGKGLRQGTQNLLGFLPATVAPTDFIYSVIAEEKGYLGSITLISLYSLLFICLARTALRTPDPFGRLVVVGILAMLFAHVTINVSMTIGLLPIVGLPLPLVSYGGSFVLSMMLALGLVQSVHTRRD